MKEVVNIRIDRDILDQIKNYQLLVGNQSGFIPNRTSVIERLIVLGLEEVTDDYEVHYHMPQGADQDDEVEIQLLAQEIATFARAWLYGEKKVEEE